MGCGFVGYPTNNCRVETREEDPRPAHERHSRRAAVEADIR